MPDTERIAQLAALAATITHKPMNEQFQVLGAAGLTLTDINWENCTSDAREREQDTEEVQ